MSRKKIIRISTVPLSLKVFCKELIREISDSYDVVAVSSSGRELDDLADDGIDTRAVEMRREISPMADLRSLFELVRLFRRERPDMVHSITPKAGLLAMTAAWIARVPVRLHSFTGLVFPTSRGLKRAVLKTTDRVTCLFATHIHPEGQGVRDDLIRARITGKPLRVLGHGNIRGVDTDRYDRTDRLRAAGAEIRRRAGIDDDACLFVFVGRIVRDKGINELAEAFTRLSQKRPDVHLMLVGAEEATDPISPQAQHQLQTNPRVHLTAGWIDDARPYYAAADALVFPSYREGFPNVVLEAGAMHLPSIVTDINGSREIITHGDNGLIALDPLTQQLESCMLTLADNPDLRRQMGRKARQNVTAKYSAPYVRQCLKDYYREILS